jgi:hypothetical protein
MPSLSIGQVAGLTTTLSVGYVMWLIRGGQILAGVMSQLPAWRFIDPLPILSSLPGQFESREDDSIESLLDKGLESNSDDRLKNEETLPDSNGNSRKAIQ